MKIGKIEPNSTKAKDPLNDGRRVKLSFKERNVEMAKQVLTELVSQIPRGLDETFKNNSERWNCGYDCIHFVPAEERDKQTDLCTKKTGVVSYKKKRCPNKEIREELIVVPNVIEEIDDEELKTIPKKPKKELW